MPDNPENELSFLFIKPETKDEIHDKLETSLEAVDLIIKNKFTFTLTRDFLEEHYNHIKKEVFFESEMIPYLEGQIVVAYVIEGLDSVNKVMNITGETNPEKCTTTQLRSMFGTSYMKNAVHRSDSIASARIEIMRATKYKISH